MCPPLCPHRAGLLRMVLWRSLPSELADENGVPEVLTRVGFAPSSLDRGVCSYSSRMAIGKGSVQMRHRLASKLAAALFHYGTRAGIQVDFIICVAEHVVFFKRLGYREFAPDVESPDTRRQCQLTHLLAEDAAHLRKVRSPLAEYSR